MTEDRIFAWLLVIVYVTYSIIKINVQKIKKFNGNSIEIDISKYDIVILNSFILIEVVIIFFFIFFPKYFIWAKADFSIYVRICGFVLCVFALCLFIWTHKHLGIYFFNSLKIKKNHKLIVSGPYKFVRHPMYSTYYIFNTGIFLISSNYFIGILWLSCLTVLVLYRFRKEEEMLRMKFGIEYINYHRITPAFIPYFKLNGKTVKSIEKPEVLN